MPWQRILLVLAFLLAMALFAFQLWRVLRPGHVRWRVHKIHRDHRPVAFWLEVAACAVGFVLFAGLLAANLAQ